MNAFTYVFIAAALASLCLTLWLARRHAGHVLAHRATVPGEFADSITLSAHQRAAGLEVAGIQNILTKSIKRDNPHNVVRATFDALKQLRQFSEIAAARGKTVAEIME